LETDGVDCIASVAASAQRRRTHIGGLRHLSPQPPSACANKRTVHRHAPDKCSQPA
jgi:hypothetical protein